MRISSMSGSVALFAMLYVGLVNTSLAGPAINVGALNEYISAQKNTLAKRIYNTGDATAFVRVSVSEIIYDKNSGTATEHPLDENALISGKGTGIISSPPRLIIPANGMQTNRLVFTGSRDKERYYRVRYIPVVPSQTEGFGLDNKDMQAYQDQINAGVTVLTGFGTIVTVQPETTKFNTLVASSNNKLSVSNNGNASVVISGIKSCDRSLKNCGSPVNVQLRPGSKLERTAEENKVWLYSLTEGSQKKNLSTGSSS
ncbi:hypothetical protein SAMN04487787_108218 [Kosakonia sacchari]|nr:hypothetical protein SAMN04487787_108218 [Kosakonia sacchari]